MNVFVTLQSGILQALGMSIIHSLWEGALILAPVLLILSLVRKDHARLRYIVLYTGLMAMLSIFLYTFMNVFQSFAAEKSPDSSSTIYLSSASLSIGNYTDSLISGNIFRKLLQWILLTLDPVAPVLAIIWFIGFTVAGIQLLSGLYVSQAVIRKNSTLPEYPLQNMFNRLRENLHIPAWIQLRLSAKKISPMVVGILKPAVIIPIAALSNLSPDQVEAIITHELAHIRRYDHVFLIIQKIAEQILFFHPMAWYLSSAINREREHCCDDLVLRTHTDPLNYIKALTMVQEMNLGGIVPSNAVINKPKRLLSRITRLIRPAVNHSPLLRLAIMFAFLITAGFVFATTIGYPFHSKHDLKQTSAPVVQQDTTISQPDTTKTVIMFYKDVDSSRYITSIITSPEFTGNLMDVGEGNVIKIIMAHDTIKEILVNGNPVPPEEFDKYKKSFKAGRIEINIQDEAPDSVGRDAKEFLDKEIEIIIRDPNVSSLYNDYMNKYLTDIYINKSEAYRQNDYIYKYLTDIYNNKSEAYRQLMQEQMNISQEERQRALEEMTERLKMQEEAQERYRQAQKEMQERLKLSEEERQRMLEEIHKNLLEKRLEAMEKMKEAQENYRQAQKEMQERLKLSEEEKQRILEEIREYQENLMDQEKLEQIKEDALRKYEEQQKMIKEWQKQLNDSLLRNSTILKELPNITAIPDLSLYIPSARPVPDADVMPPAFPEINALDLFLLLPSYSLQDDDESDAIRGNLEQLESTLQELEK